MSKKFLRTMRSKWTFPNFKGELSSALLQNRPTGYLVVLDVGEHSSAYGVDYARIVIQCVKRKGA